MLHTKITADNDPRRPKCTCGAEADWHGPRDGRRQFCCDRCWDENQEPDQDRVEIDQLRRETDAAMLDLSAWVRERATA